MNDTRAIIPDTHDARLDQLHRDVAELRDQVARMTADVAAATHTVADLKLDLKGAIDRVRDGLDYLEPTDS